MKSSRASAGSANEANSALVPLVLRSAAHFEAPGGCMYPSRPRECCCPPGSVVSWHGVARVTRTRWLKVVALVVALASLTINFGLIDLIDGYTGYVDQARNQVLDAGWGLVFGVIVPVGLLAQLRRPERRIAGIQQTAVVALALAVAGIAGEEWGYLALAAGITGLCAALLALHPARHTFLERGHHLEPVLLALAAVAAVPCLV